MTDATIQFTSAVPGSGKTYGRGVRFAVHEFLPYQKGDFWSNYPLRVDEMVAYVCAKHPNLVADEVRDRIKIFPKEELRRWAAGESTPGEFFKGKDIRGAHIAIDEVHKFVDKNSSKDVLKSWQIWLGELRHDMATFECLSQHEMKVNKSIRDHAEIQRFMFNTERKPDPFFGVLMGDWYELRAGFITGEYRSKVVEAVKQDSMGKLVLSPELGRVYALDPELFALYDSYSGRDDSARDNGKGRQRVFQTHSKVALLAWFFRRNWYKIGPRLLVIVLVVWLCFFGGMTWCTNKFISTMQATKGAPDSQSTDAKHPKKSASGASSTSRPGSSSPSFFNQSSGPASSAGDPADPVAVELSTLRATIDARDKEIEKLKADSARFAEVVALFNNQITLRCGVTVDVGEEIPLGPLKGRKIKGISHEKRRVALDDGSVLPLSP